MIAGASITEERKASGWIFSDGYYDANQSMAVEASSDITGFDGRHHERRLCREPYGTVWIYHYLFRGLSHYVSGSRGRTGSSLLR